MTAPTDRDLILRACRGANDAFGELVTRYQTGVCNVCYRMLHERGEAEDLFNNSSFYIILNVAVGGNYVGFPTAQTPFPQKMYIDYVKVYQ